MTVRLLITILMMAAAIGFVPSSHAQFSDQDDIWNEIDNEELTLNFYDALTGDPIEDAKVEISGIGKFTTDWEGKAMFPIPEEDGYYKVTFLKSGYIKSNFKIEIMAGTLFFNRFSISPAMPLEYVRVVLDWDETPKDLDAHMVKHGKYHISYRKMRVSEDGVTKLDRDDVDGHGPETITSTRIDNDADYTYFVHDYTDRNDSDTKNLSKSKGTVKIYGDGQLLQVMHVPEDMEGNYWEVFKITEGQVIPTGEVTGEEPGR